MLSIINVCKSKSFSLAKRQEKRRGSSFVIRPSRLARVIVSSVPSHIEYWEHRVERIEWATSNRAVKGPSLSFTVLGFTY